MSKIPPINLNGVLSKPTDLAGILAQPINLADALSTAPMPKYYGPEPTEIDIARIRKLVDADKFGDLPWLVQRWVTRRLMPSLTRYGYHPPPVEKSGGAV